MFDKLVHVGNAHGFTLETGRLKGLRYPLHGGKAAVGKPLRDFDKQAGILAGGLPAARQCRQRRRRQRSFRA